MASSPLENTMLYIVRHTVLGRLFIARTRADHNADIRHRRGRPAMHNTNAVGQSMIKSLIHCLHNSIICRTFAAAFRGIGGIGRRARLRIWFLTE